ncbi:probable glycosyltransferase STELLO1 [Phragmites australis]|uniref:probable glycosyltransferase STELLO1 n=1 Tax=Phragmites australis TaxID=29695 RepID=UPI002D775CE9|nr:probable glycosyltransferase STELLO1 [Phragmites australis]
MPPHASPTPASRRVVYVLLAALASAPFLLLLLLYDGASPSALCPAASRRLSYPSVLWSRVPPLPALPTSPHPALRASRWIVFSASPHHLRHRPLRSVPGWQLLAVADEATPAGWSHPGAVLLTLADQALLGFRSVAFLPTRGPARKAAAYLFAVQRGARVIYDADARNAVVGGNLSCHFDVDLDQRQGGAVLLQYSHADPNRTVVNPYVHFGQPSVWPRGLPLERAGEVGSEEFYTEVFGGGQFIQQGLCNGLPDVDAVFYFTRKSSEMEAFDFRFDADAPKVALPQGMMTPVNYVNTLFHSAAFWGLALPVSVSPMASDVIRGYWVQRILWEIGGYLVVYPPTVHRIDDVHAHPFDDEKDIHVNVGRLIKFLLEWRSRKQTLFERILDLSYAMTEERFWAEKDLHFMAAWLQDLVAVGYRQPRLMSLEIDRPRATIGHGDKLEFSPKKLPSVHLGVEEIGEVSTEIGNLIKWRKHFGDVVLIVHCTEPVDRTALEWRLLYGRIFRAVVILSEQGNSDLAVEFSNLAQAYKYLPKVFDRFAGAQGFLFLQDHMVLNYWSLLNADKAKLWITNQVKESWSDVPLQGNKNDWFVNQGEMVKKAVGSFPFHYQANYKRSVGENKIIHCSSEIFYIPQRHISDFSYLVKVIGSLDIHHNIAVPMLFLAMDSPSNFESKSLTKLVYRTDLPSNTTFSTIYTAEAHAVYPVKVRNEMDFVKLIRVMASGDPFLMELV